MTLLDEREVFVPITKKDRDPETGHLYVYGKITGPDLDNDQQRMDPVWLKTAVPDWFKRGNLREQHDAKRAIGRAIELEEKTDGWYIGAKVVDKDAIEKVEEEILNGFSIGIRNWRLDHTKADAPAGTVVAGRIFETSLVDAPCLGSATISDHWRLPLAKADSGGELRDVDRPALLRASTANYGLPAELYDRLAAPVKQALADLAASGAQVAAEVEVLGDEPATESAKADSANLLTPVVVNVTVQAPVPDLAKYTAQEERDALAAGQAMPNAKGDPSYVIKTKADLRRAIKAVGRGKADHDDVRKHIITRAKALGLEGMVPENWNADGSLKDAAKADADPETVAKAEALLRNVRALVPDLAKADGDTEDGDGPDGDEDETEDIAGAQEAIAVIAKLIVAEAESLAMGNLNEACDIALLLDAVRALKWFQANERAEQSGADTVMMLADAPTGGGDLLKADSVSSAPQPPSDAVKADAAAASTGADAAEPLLTKAEAADAIAAAVAAALTGTQTSAADTPQTVTKTELADMVKSAVAEARTADEERIAALTADLAKAQGDLDAIKAMPVPGGPVLTRTAAQQESAHRSDSEALHAQANALLAKADAFSANRDLAEGYRQRAKALLAKAAA